MTLPDIRSDLLSLSRAAQRGYSKQLLSFTKLLLEIDPSKRLDAMDLLSHPLFFEYTPKKQKILSSPLKAAQSSLATAPHEQQLLQKYEMWKLA